MKILSLSAENIKRLSVVEITPDGSPILVIGGHNGAGKSSVLDAIEMALGGASAVPSHPVRNGQARGKVVIDLGDFIVTRTFTAATGATALVVSSKDGAKYGSPQALLDKLIGKLSFDPLAFERMDVKKQAETLRVLVGLSTADLDNGIAEVYEERTSVNRTVKQLEGQIANMHAYEKTPKDEVSIAGLTKELEAAEESRRAYDQARSRYESAARDYTSATETVATSERAVEALQVQIAAINERLVAERGVIQERLSTVDAAKQAGLAAKTALVDSAPIRARLIDAETINQHVRANVAIVEAVSAVKEERKVAQDLTDKLAALEIQKRARLAQVAMPIDGLAFSDGDGLLFDGVPFDQASQAQRLRVSVAVGLALNPQLKVLLVREGSALDRTSLALLGELAAAADAQIWVEMVKEVPGEGVSVFIEDGTVKTEPVEVAQ